MMAHRYAWIIWRLRIASAFRTGLACSMVALAIEFYDSWARQPMNFQAFAYLTAVLIVEEACLGEAVRGAVFALYGTVQGVCSVLLGIWLIGPSRFSAWTVMLGVTISAFLVSIPKSTHIVAKRVALGQIVIVYVSCFAQREKGVDAILYPLHAALSTALGVAASVLALLLPVPRLASLMIEEKSSIMADITSSMLKTLVNGYCTDNISSARASLCQFKTMADCRTYLVATVRDKQDNVGWERLLLCWLSPNSKVVMARILSLERPLRGMEIALASCSSFPVNNAMEDKGIEDLYVIADEIGHFIEKLNFSPSNNSIQAYDIEAQPLQISFRSQDKEIPSSCTDLPPLFFLFCMQHLYEQTATPVMQQKTNVELNSYKDSVNKYEGGWFQKIDTGSLLMAVKCSISLGLSVLFGICFSRDNGYWGGLALAVSMTATREPTFKVANMRIQGTALGSVYGVLGCFLTQRFEFLRYIALIPWVIFTSFIRHSEMYGYVGGFTAFVGAVVILGRRNYGPPSEFAIDRMTETFLAFVFRILVELIFLPRRAATLARATLLETVMDLNGFINLISCTDQPCSKFLEMKEALSRSMSRLSELKNFVAEAKAEPDFWFLPFPHAGYEQVLGSLSNMIELLHFMVEAIYRIQQLSCTNNIISDIDILKFLNEELQSFKNRTCSYFVCFQEVLQIKCLGSLVEEFHKKKNDRFGDPEADEDQRIDCQDFNTIIDSFLGRIREIMTHVEGTKEMRIQLVMCLSSMGFCTANIMKQRREMEKGIQWIIQRENPLAHVNLWEISRMSMKLRSWKTL